MSDASQKNTLLQSVAKRKEPCLMNQLPTRRLFLGALALGGAAWTVRGAFAEELTKTPAQTEGPFYPDKLPLDTDNDLLIVNDSITPAVGDVTHLSGKILDAKGHPIKNALVEIWQCDSKGVYLHTDDSSKHTRDKNFQGFGRFLTGSGGEYYFRTIKPVAYPQRPAPHIHFKIKRGGKELLVTQCYIKGEANNEKDFIYQAIRDRKQRDSVTIDFTKVKDSKIGELKAQFDIVLGITPEM
jgi:protocatechuate 3,4-dioxygenase beta subunit